MTDGTDDATEVAADPMLYRVPDGHLGFMVLLPGLTPILADVDLTDFHRALAQVEHGFAVRSLLTTPLGDPRLSLKAFLEWRHAQFEGLRTAAVAGDRQTSLVFVARLMWAAMNYPGRRERLRADLSEVIAEHGFAALALVDDGRGHVATVAGEDFRGLREWTQEVFDRIPVQGAPASYAPEPRPVRRVLH